MRSQRRVELVLIHVETSHFKEVFMSQFKVVDELPEPYRLIRDVVIMPNNFAYAIVVDDPTGRFTPEDPLGIKTGGITEDPILLEVDGIRYRGFWTQNTLYVTTESIDDLRRPRTYRT